MYTNNKTSECFQRKNSTMLWLWTWISSFWEGCLNRHTVRIEIRTKSLAACSKWLRLMRDPLRWKLEKVTNVPEHWTCQTIVWKMLLLVSSVQISPCSHREIKKLCISLCCFLLPFVFSLEKKEPDERSFSDLRKYQKQNVTKTTLWLQKFCFFKRAQIGCETYRNYSKYCSYASLMCVKTGHVFSLIRPVKIKPMASLYLNAALSHVQSQEVCAGYSPGPL